MRMNYMWRYAQSSACVIMLLSALQVIAEPQPEWRKILADGTVVELATVANPEKFPQICWRPDGQATVRPDQFELSEASAGLQLLFHIRRAGDADSVARERNQWVQYALKKKSYAEAPHVWLFLSGSEWEKVGELKAGKTIRIKKARYTLRKIEPFQFPPSLPTRTKVYLEYRIPQQAGIEHAFAAVDRQGNRHKKIIPAHVQICEGERTLRNTHSQGVKKLTFDLLPQELDHVEVLNRPRAWVEFADFALEPAIAAGVGKWRSEKMNSKK